MKRHMGVNMFPCSSPYLSDSALCFFYRHFPSTMGVDDFMGRVEVSEAQLRLWCAHATWGYSDTFTSPLFPAGRSGWLRLHW